MIKTKYDKNGNVIKKTDLSSNIIYTYKYDQNKRIVKIYMKNSKSKTVIKDVLSEHGYLTIEKKDYSDKFIQTVTYDNEGKEKKIIRYNRKTRKRYIKENIIFKDNKPVFWIEKYSKKTDFGFKHSIKYNF